MSPRRVLGCSCAALTRLVLFLLFPLLLNAANPIGEQVVSGSVSFDRSVPGVLTIGQGSDRAIINWDDFSIGAGDITRFLQPGVNSAALNRVTGGNPSSIHGQLQANGQVFLINPAGILVGANGQIDTAGVVASTLDLSNDSFLSNARLTLSGSSDASVQNLGQISASEGDVYLIARRVENAGSISASAGTIGLVGGTEVVLAENGGIAVLYGSGGGVDNSGSITAASAELKAAGGNIYALAINNSGVIRANSLVNAGGRIVLEAVGGATVHTGTLEAAGGEVQVLGDQVALNDNAVVDVSGARGGGMALIGGGFQGKADGVVNAQQTFVGADARIKADGGANGDGGTVVVWADELTRYYGNISARGGVSGGDGGNVEVSGKVNLAFDGEVDVKAATGASGSVLLDPRDLTIRSSGADDSSLTSTGLGVAGPPIASVDATVSSAAIEGLSGNITLEAARDLTIESPLNLLSQQGSETVAFTAGGDLTINAAVTTEGAAMTFTASSSSPSFDNSSSATLTISAPAIGGDTTFVNDGSGGIVLNVWLSNESKNVTFSDKLILGSDVMIEGANVTFTGTVNGDLTVNARELTVSTSGTASFGAALGASGQLGLLKTEGSGGTTINTSSIRATTQEYENAVTLGVTTTLTATDVTFSSTVDGSTAATESLTVNASGTSVFRGVVGGVTSLSSMTTDTAGSTTLTGGAVTGTTLTFNDDVTLGANTTLSGTTILFNKQLDADLEANNRTLSVVSTGTTTFTQSVGLGPDDTLDTSDDLGLGSISTDAGGTTLFKGVGFKADVQTYADGVEIGSDATLSAATATFSDTLKASGSGRDLTLNVSGTTTFGSTVGSTTFASITTDAPGSTVVNTTLVKGTTMTFNDPMTIGANAVFQGSTATFNNTVNGGVPDTYDLTVNATTTTFGASAVAGASGILRSLITNSSGTTSINSGNIYATTQTYSDDIVIGANTTLTGGTVSLNDGIDGDATVNNRTLTINANSATTLAGTVGATGILASLITDAAGSTSVNGTIRATTQSYRDKVTVASNSTLKADENGAGSVRFFQAVDGSTSGGQTLTINATTTVFDVAVGGTTKLATLTTDSVGTVTLKGGAITATTHNYNDAVTVTADTTFTGTTVSFNGTLDSDATSNNRTLTVNASGTTTFANSVGATGQFSTIETDSAGSTTIDTTSITAGTSQTYNDTVTVSENLTLTASTLSFGKAVNADSSVQNRTLTVNATTTTFSAAVGTSTSFAAFTTDAAGTTTLNGSVTAVNQTYNDNTVIAVNATLTGTGGAVSFASGKTLNADVAATRNLTINTTTTTLAGTVGASQSFNKVTTDSTGTTTLSGGSVNATTQDYNDAVVIGAATTLTGTTINLDGTVDSDSGQNRALTINASGVTTLKSVVGATDALSSLTTDISGTLSFTGSAVTVGDTTSIADGTDLFTIGTHGLGIGDAVTFSGASLPSGVTAGTAYYVIASGLTANDFRVSTVPSGTTIDVTSAGGSGTAKTGQRIITTGAQIYNEPVTVSVASPGLILRGGSIEFAGTVNANSSSSNRLLTLTSGGAKTLGGVIGGTAQFGTLTASGGGSVAINSSDITTVTQTYVDNVTIGATTELTATSVTFSGTIDADEAANSRGLTITASGATTISGVVGASKQLGALTTDSTGTLALNAGTVAATTQIYNDVTTLGANTTLTGTDVRFENILDSDAGMTRTLTVNASGTTTFGESVGDTDKLAALTTDIGGSVEFTGAALTVGTTSSINDTTDVFTIAGHGLAVGDLVVFSGGGLPAGMSSGTDYYVITAPDANTFTVSAIPGGTTLDVTSAGGVGSAITGPRMGTTGAQSYGDPVTVAAASPGLNMIGTNITFDQSVNADNASGNRHLVLNSTGAVLFSGEVGNTDVLGTLTEVASTSLTVSGGSVDATTQRYTQGVTLGADATFKGTDLTFASTVAGASNNLTLSTVGTVTFGGAVTGVADLESDNGGTSSIGANVTTSGTQTYDDAVVLAASVTLDSTGDKNVSFNSTVDGITAGNQSLIVSTQGTVTFGGIVGGTTSLSALTTSDGGGTSELTSIGGGTITVANAITFGDNLKLSANTTLNASAVTFPATQSNSDANNLDVTLVTTGGGDSLAADFFDSTIRNLTVTSTSGTTLNGAVTTTGKQTYNSAVTLATGAVTVTGTDITFASTVGGGQNLLIAGGGVTTVSGTVTLTGAATFGLSGGGLTQLNANVTTATGAQTYGNPIVLTGATVLTSANPDITLDAVIGGGNTFTVTTGAGAGDVILGGTISGVTNLSLTSGTGTIAINVEAITTTGSQTYSGNVTLGGASSLKTLTGTTATFTGTVAGGGKDLTLDFSGLTTLASGFGGGAIGDLILANTGGTTTINGSITTTGVQTYQNPVTLVDGAITLTGAGLTFSSSVTGDGGASDDLTITDTGTTTVTGAITAVDTLTFSAGASGTILNNGTVTSLTAINLNSAVTLGADTTLTGAVTTGAAGTIDGAGDGTESLTITGSAVLAGDIGTGANKALEFLSVSGTSSLGATITTTTLGGGTGNQTYTGAVTLTGASVLTGGTPTFTAGVTTGANQNLTLDFSGATVIDGSTFGSVSDVNNLAIGNGGTISLTGTITTVGSQTYSDAVTLTANAILVSSGNSAISLNSTVNGGGFDLTTTTTAATAFGGALSNIGALVTGGATTISGGTVATSGAQTYGGTITLGADSTLSGTTPTFAGTAVTGGGFDLTLNFSGATTVNNTFSGIKDFASGSGGGITINGGSLVTTGSQTFSDDVTLGAATTLTGTDITLAAVDAATFDLTLNGTGATTINGALSNLAAFTIGNGGTATLSGNITSTGTQTYTDALTLTADTTMNSGAAAIAVAGVTGGGFDLTLTSTGAKTLSGAISGVVDLAVTAGGTGTSISGSSIATTGIQTYGETITLGTDVVLSGTTPTLAATAVTGAGFDLTLNFSGTTVIDSTFSGIKNFASGGGGGTTLNGATFTTTGTMTFSDSLALGAAPTITGTSITLAAVTGSGGDFTVDGTGTLTLGGAISSVAALTVTDSGGSPTGTITLNAGGSGIVTTGNQTYDRAVTLAGQGIFNAGTANIVFEETITGGGNAITLTTSGDGQFKKSATGLSTLVTSAGGQTIFGSNGGGAVSITTSGTQLYFDEVDSWVDATLTGSSVTLSGGQASPLVGGGSASITTVP